MLKDKISAIAIKAAGSEVDYVILYGRKVDEPSAPIVCDD